MFQFQPCLTPLPHAQDVLRAEGWQAALQRARGEKVLDDPKLLRRSLKREGKSKQKSAAKWAARQSAAAEAQEARQSKCVGVAARWERGRGARARACAVVCKDAMARGCEGS